MAELQRDERALVERVAAAVVARRLTTPAILLLESTKPIAFLGSQTLHFFEPMVRTLVDRPEYSTATRLLEDRAKVEALLRRIEQLEAERLEAARVETERTEEKEKP